jgi:hypothetical protein
MCSLYETRKLGSVTYVSLTPFNPDSAVAIDKKREAQPFRSEVDGFLPLSRHRSAVLRGDVEPHSNDVRKRKMTLKLHSQTPSLLQDSTSLPATAESGFNSSCTLA